MIYPRKIFQLPGLRFLCIFLCITVFLPLFAEAQSNTAPAWTTLWGTDAGLYSRNRTEPVQNLWSGGKVHKIIQRAGGWALLTDQGIWVSDNLRNWEQRNRGLPERVIKLYENREKSLINTVQEIKDLEIHPENPEIMVCTVFNAVYLSRNGGRNWENLGMPNYRANGIKAVAVASLSGSNGELTVFCSHSIYGIHYINPGRPGAAWTEMNAGLERLETTNNPDEVSDIAVTLDSSGRPEIYASQTFRRRIYKLDWEQKTWTLLWADRTEFGAVDSLSPGRNSLTFVRDNGIMELGPFSNTNASGTPPSRPRQDLAGQIRAIPASHKPNCVVLKTGQGSEIISLSELWLLDEQIPERSPDGQRLPVQTVSASLPQASASNNRAATADNREGLYLPVNHAMDPSSLRRYLNIIEERGLNMVVIDMKDDYGRLRFTPGPSMTNLGRVFRPVDIDAFLKTMKERGIFTVARVVVFKDPEAAQRDGGKYAVWDGRNNKPWEGYYDTRRKKAPPGEEPAANPALVTEILPDNDPEFEILRTWYDEKWVDSYSEEIWDYNASVAEELCRRGFDEIQFDYIRFPTDGVNLGDARYRWQDSGMDMDSAILSFLRHARSRVAAPISVDIYGANGWYRTGARTGQKVELLTPWVDVICPMYYPSHFEQTFLAQNPPELRPYRIFFQGTLRTRFIARGRVIVRPWAQAFYLNVSYDRVYYNADYVRRQLEGVRDAGTGGLTYWNNSGRYDEIPIP